MYIFEKIEKENGEIGERSASWGMYKGKDQILKTMKLQLKNQRASRLLGDM